jgi:gliding motility-associated-like protein
VTGIDIKGCTGTIQVVVSVDPKPTFSRITTQCMSNGKTYSIELATSGDQLSSKYGQVALENMLYTISNIPRNISNTIKTEMPLTGCKDSVIVPYPNCPLPHLFVPESFSPNNDGINDFFEIPGIESYPNAELTIYTRYGQSVYSTKNYKNDWDGSSISSKNLDNQKVAVGIYYYVLKPNADMGYTKGFVFVAY